MFSHHAFEFRIDKNPIAPVLFSQSVTLSALYVLIGRSMLCLLATGDISTVCASNTVSRLKLELRWTSSLRCNLPTNVSSRFKKDLKERARRKEIKRELEKKQGVKAAAELLPNESHATANVSLLSC